MERKWEAKLGLNHAKAVQHLQRVSVWVSVAPRWARSNGCGKEKRFMG